MRHKWIAIETGENTKGDAVFWCAKCGCFRKQYVGPATGPHPVKYYPVGIKLEDGALPFYDYVTRAPCPPTWT